MTSLLSSKKYQSVEEYESKAKSQLESVLTFLRKHPTLCLTLVYLFISCFGLIYIHALFTKFSVNILPHLEITDFALAAIHYPTSILFTLGLALFTWLAIKFELVLRKVKLFRTMNNKFALSYMFLNPIFFYGVLFIFAIFATNIFSAAKTYENIIQDKNQMFTLMLSNQAEISGRTLQQLNDVQIIADTYKYLWVYLKDEQQVHAIPQKNITIMLPTLNKEINTNWFEQTLNL